MSSLLIVDPNRMYRETLKEIVVRRFPKLEIHVAETGSEAMRVIEGQKQDMVIVDVHLRQGNGLRLVSRIRAGDSRVFIAVTDDDSPDYRMAAMKSGADFFLSKVTATAEDFINILEGALAEKTGLKGPG